MNITVERLDDTRFAVRVGGTSPTIHSVTVPPDYARKLAGDSVTTEQLVHRSFEFLLQREPNTSILRGFELPVIASYFPEYERVMRTLLAQ